MRTFHLLILEDDPEYHEDVIRLCKQTRTIELADGAECILKPGDVIATHVYKYNEVLEKTRARFFHLALVDPRLSKVDDPKEGLIFLKHLEEMRPVCKRVILTDVGRGRHAGIDEIVQELFPIWGKAHHLVDKDGDKFTRVIDHLAAEWLWQPVLVNGLEIVHDILGIEPELTEEESKPQKKKARRSTREVVTTPEEIDHLISRIFGQGQEWSHDGNSSTIERVDLSRVEEQGFSGAAVVLAKTSGRDPDASIPPNIEAALQPNITNAPSSSVLRDRTGIQCILKIAPRPLIQKEFNKYSKYVRFRLAVHLRVELLAWELGDTVGVLCYNFASDRSLAALLIDCDPQFNVALDNLFNPESKQWYAELHPVRLLNYMTKTNYKVDLVKGRSGVLDIVRQIEQTLEPTNQNGHSMKLAGIDFGDVGQTLNDANKHRAFSRAEYGCLIHGDLNCKNVLIDGECQPMFIDYATVGPGPRALDFVVLEASIRTTALKTHFPKIDEFRNTRKKSEEIAPEELKTMLSAIVRCYPAEIEAVRAAWDKKPPADDSAFWVKASFHTATLAAANFRYSSTKEFQQVKNPPDPPDLDKLEYAATGILWGMRMININDLHFLDKARIAVWVIALADILAKGT